MVKRILMYLRKSRAEEHETVEEVLSRHEKQLQECALRLFGTVIPEENIYREVVSGETIDNRPEMQEVLRRLQDDVIDAVLVIEPQRLSRGDMIDAGTIVRAFQYTRTKIITPQKTYDLDDKFDRKFFEMELRQGNDYLEYVKEILQRGRLHSVKQGNYVGSASPYGYKKVKDGKNYTLEIVPEEAEVVRFIYDWFIEKIGTSNICKKLNALGKRSRNGTLWKPDRVREILHNPIYCGKIRWNWRKTVKKYEDGKIVNTRPRNTNDDSMIIDGKHPIIIELEKWELAQTLFGHPAKITNNRELRCIFAGFLHCECGYAMTFRTDGGKAKPRVACIDQVNCGHKSAIYEEVEEAVKQALMVELAEYKALAKGNKSKREGFKKAAIESIKKDLAKLDDQEDKLYTFLEDGTYTKDVFLKRKKLLEENRSRLSKLLEEAEKNVEEKKSYKDAIVKLSEAIKTIKNKSLSATAKNKLLGDIIEDIIYSRKVPEDRRKYRDVPFALQIKLKI